MKIRRRTVNGTIRLPMSPMIDIIFLLLIFFVMTFQIVPLEGDLTIAAPLSQSTEPTDPSELPIEPPLRVRLVAHGDGTLQTIEAANREFDNTAEFAQYLRVTYAGGASPEQEAVIVADEQLNYSHTIETVTALSGYVDGTGRTVKLISKVRFAPR